MDASKKDDRIARIQPDDVGANEVHADVGFAGDQRCRHRSAMYFKVADIAETLSAQQLLGNVLRSPADTTALDELELRYFRRRLLGVRLAGADDARSAGR